MAQVGTRGLTSNSTEPSLRGGLQPDEAIPGVRGKGTERTERTERTKNSLVQVRPVSFRSFQSFPSFLLSPGQSAVFRALAVHGALGKPWLVASRQG